MLTCTNFEPPILLIDSDSIYFRICCVAKKPSEIRKGINHTMKQIQRDNEADKLLVAIKGKGNFRKDIFPKYKANRPQLDDDMRKALTYGHQYMVDRWEAVMADGMEADDLCAIWAAEMRDLDTNYTVVGIDKDLLQIPGNHYNFNKREHSFVDYDAANYNLMVQCITGDGTDNIPGLKGIGPVKAKRILAGVPMPRRWNRVRAAWRARNGGDPFLSRRLLEMLTSWSEYDSLRNQIESETSISQSDVLERKESKDESVSSVSE